jgi:hypothetical protein
MLTFIAFSAAAARQWCAAGPDGVPDRKNSQSVNLITTRLSGALRSAGCPREVAAEEEDEKAPPAAIVACMAWNRK